MKKIFATILISLGLFTQFHTAQAARIYSNGFEWQSTTAGVEILAINGTPTINTTTKHSGAASMEVSGNITTGVVEDANYTFAGCTKCWLRYYVYLSSQTADANVVTYLDTYNGATNITSTQWGWDGANYTATVFYNNFGASLASTFTVTSGAWHYIEMLYDTTPANGSEVLTVKLDGAQVASATNLTLTTKTMTNTEFGVFNGTAGTISDTTALFDDLAVNNTTGSSQVDYAGVGNIVLVKPTGSGDNACTTGLFSYINEVPPSDTATSGSTICELDSNGVIGDFNVTDSSTAGIDSYDTITLVQVMARMREETAGTSLYNLRVKSAASGTVSATSDVDAGNATARTNPTGTTAFTNQLVSYTDPTTGIAWTPTGTNSIDNMQVGVANTDAVDSTPDAWILTLGAQVEYVDGSPPPAASTARRRIIISE